MTPFDPLKGMMDTRVLQDWQRSMRSQGLSGRTVTERARTVASIAVEAGITPDGLTVGHIEEWLSNRPHLAASSRTTYISALHSFSRWAIVRGIREDDPTTLLGKPPVRRSAPRAVTTEQLTLLLGNARRTRMRAYLTLAAFMGLRAHEIAKVRGEDVDLLAGRLFVKGKGGTEVWMDMHPRVAALAEQMPRRGWWFPSYRDPRKPVRANSVSNAVSKFMAAQGVPGTCHSLRHWHATELMNKGVNVRVVQDLMRHASLQTTGRYIRVLDSQRREALRELSA